MITKTRFGLMSQLLTALLAGALLLSACAPAVPATMLPEPTEIPSPVATMEPAPTTAPQATAALPPQAAAPQLSINTGGLASGLQTEIVPAVSAADNGPFWDLLPQYTRVTLQDYPLGNHIMKAQIFIYPVAELGKTNEGAGNIADALQTLLKSPQDLETMPFMPLYNASQVMHVQTQFLDFKNGQGVRFLTQFDQAFIPVNNSELIYSYQGLTSDGKYYVAAVLPVNHPSLPADGNVTGKEPPEFTSDFPTYMANVVKSLNPQAANTFTPDLTQLDAMISSIEIK
jgi:hypothetical protein